MSLTALSPEGTVLIARDVTKQDGPFRCSACEAQMIIKKGLLKIDHFAHVPNTSCEYGSGETEEHLVAKMSIYDNLRAKDINVILEKPLSPKVRADLLIEYPSGRKVAIEVQRSTMTREECIRRMLNYQETGIPVLWILLNDVKDGWKRVIQQEKFFHGIYFGKVIYFDHGSVLKVFTFSDWYRKTFKKMLMIGKVDLADEWMFKVKRRKEWNTLPEGLLWDPDPELLGVPEMYRAVAHEILKYKGREIIVFDDNGSMEGMLAGVSQEGIILRFPKFLEEKCIPWRYAEQVTVLGIGSFFVPKIDVNPTIQVNSDEVAKA